MFFLLLGNNYFQQALIDSGHKTVWVSDDPGGDLKPPGGRYCLNEILKLLPGRPDVILLTDDLGKRVFPEDLNQTGILKVYYAVDSPINYFWQKHQARLFDLVLVDQKDCVEKLKETVSGRIHWLPVAVDTARYNGPFGAKNCDLSFVGVINETVRPKRSRIIDLLSRRFRMVTAGGRGDRWLPPEEAARLYKRSRIVINENLFPGVTTRMLESMASGTMLLTEAQDHGLTDLFTPGEHLGWYRPDDLVDKVDYFLAHEAEREQIAARGREMVLTAHDIRHRTQSLLDLIQGFPAGLLEASDIDLMREQGKALFLAGLRWPHQEGEARILRAEEFLERFVNQKGEDPEALFYLGAIAKLKGEIPKARARWSQAMGAGSIRSALGLGFLDLNSLPALAWPHFRAIARWHCLSFPSPDGQNSYLSAEQHHCLGLILEKRGHDFTAGFTRFGLDMSTWNAFEHYLAAVRLNPIHVPSLVSLGRLLAGHGAWVEAHFFLQRAVELEPGRMDLIEEADRAGLWAYARYANERQAA